MSTRKERDAQIQELTRQFQEAKSIYLTDFRGIDVEKITGLRQDLRKKGITYRVVKNTLAGIAFKNSGKEAIVPYLTGPVGVMIDPQEPTEAAKAIKDFQKEHKGLLPCTVADVEGNVFQGDQVDRLASVPSREVLLAQLLSALKGPVSGLAAGLNGILYTFVRTLDAVREKKESQQSQ
jgi:large subunit ribosomal protein L10